ncbi:phosphonatase-like hydrolase [Saccharopolyspora sp. HNM0983]|uniref:Phosphonatase-like hydrolase n=1 Tax=Saccharopolyspora montiporae TaxID=2781240 RepID=A0A929BAC2_9PSEU|nr:phosphonatase-like hydrolase [Saccharopolyspora sp. HNM0983]MBE9375105.1 phosphonatase-like hydrolase [Saccharopolyspora sp. HNM0983]
MIRLVVLDMAGTTVADDGLVEQAFTRAIGEVGVARSDERFPGMLALVRRTMGESKISVFRELLGDEAAARRANSAFETAYGDSIADGGCRPVDGAREVIEQLRDAGVLVALTTGFSAATQQQLLTGLGWQDLVDLALTPAQAGRGRPYPDLVLTSLLRLGVDDVREVAVAGDTAGDIRSAVRAGAGIAAGVLTGAHGRQQLREAGATHVLGSVRELPAHVLGTTELRQDFSGTGPRAAR